MVRKPSIWFPGAKFHITSRGVRKSPLFYNDEDRYEYLATLAELKEKYQFTIHTYCLMTNHTHLHIETSKCPPEKIMQLLNLKYAKYFNKKYSFSGHVFEKRYSRELINSVHYELDVSKYIHYNPLKAGMINKLEEYPWSSYNTYIHLEKNPLITTDYILSYFPHPRTFHYKNFVKSKFSFAEFNISENPQESEVIDLWDTR